jgi:DNA-binding transcriptional regulator YiaG
MYSQIERLMARRLYVESGYTYENIAKAMRISAGQLKSWGKNDDWRKARESLSSAARCGDSAAVYRHKAEADRVVRLVSSINRRRKRDRLGAEPKNIPELTLTPDELMQKRLAAGLSQCELAARLGVNEKRISAWEQGRAPISKLAQIAITSVLSDASSASKAS